MLTFDKDAAHVFVDGSCWCKDPLRRGGYGLYIPRSDKDGEIIAQGYWNTTISRMEMRALLKAIEIAKHIDTNKLTVFSDSQFVVNTIKNGLLFKWRIYDYIGVKNAELWKEIAVELDKLKRQQVKFDIVWIRGHQKDVHENYIAYGNACADLLADYKTHKEYIQDLPLTQHSWICCRELNYIFIDKTDNLAKLKKQGGNMTLLGDCYYANEDELFDRLNGTALFDDYYSGKFKVEFKIENI